MSAAAADPVAPADLLAMWAPRWPAALALWSPYLRLGEPHWCLTADDERREGLDESFAMIRHRDKAVVISLRQVAARGLAGFPLEIMGHEIGHHAFAPADMLDHGRMLARMRPALPGVEHLAPTVANLYTDLLINDRLHRRHGLDLAGVYRTLDADGRVGDGGSGGGGSGDGAAGPPSPLWVLYLRVYERLWALPTGSLGAASRHTDERIDADAYLGAQVLRVFAVDWLDGAGRFAALVLPYLVDLVDLDDEAGPSALAPLADLGRAGDGVDAVPVGLSDVDADERAGAVHPAFDPRLNGGIAEDAGPKASTVGAVAPREPTGPAGPVGQARRPYEYGELLRSMGIVLDDHEIAVRYYREQAAQRIIPFPSRRAPDATEPHPEGLEPWDVGSPLDEIDWVGTMLRSPVVVPGTTTVTRAEGHSPGPTPERRPVDLDLYVDSSGSMPNPQIDISYPTLAGAILALSALRAGAAVQATLWSGADEFHTTDGFVRDEHAILGVLTGWFGSWTQFPIHILRDTYAHRPPGSPPVHIVCVSDDGIDTMFGPDELGGDGTEIARRALAAAGAGGTMVLQLWRDVGDTPGLQPALDMGWSVHPVRELAELEAFARAFAAHTWGDELLGSPGSAR